MDDRGQDSDAGRPRRPRGFAIAIAIAALLACILVIVAVSGDEGSTAQLRWIEEQRIPDSRLIEIPNSFGHEMGILDPELRATAADSEGQLLYGVAATLWMDAGSPVGDSRASCSIATPGAEAAATPDSRASFPRPGPLTGQSVPRFTRLRLSPDSQPVAVPIRDLLGDQLATEEGIKVRWPRSRNGEVRFEWLLPSDPPEGQLELRFATAGVTTSMPSAKIACSLTTEDGTVALRTGGTLSGHPPPGPGDEG